MLRKASLGLLIVMDALPFVHKVFRVVNATRDLGAHVVYTRQLSNSTLLDRIEGLSDFWVKLKSAVTTYKQKVTLVRRWQETFRVHADCSHASSWSAKTRG